jgi:hypothetical protein
VIDVKSVVVESKKEKSEEAERIKREMEKMRIKYLTDLELLAMDIAELKYKVLIFFFFFFFFFFFLYFFTSLYFFSLFLLFLD